MLKPKIAVIGLKGLPAFGGAATVGESLISRLQNDFNFTVYSVASHTNNKGQQKGYYQIVFRTFSLMKLNIFFYYLKSAFHALFFENYDLIHLHHVDGAFILPLLRLKYKVILTSHARPQIAEKWPWYVKFFFRINERVALILSNEVSCVSEMLMNYYNLVSVRKIYYIPNGVELILPVKEHNIPFNDYILFAAGRIIPLKGLHILIKSLKITGYKGKLIVAGNIDQMPDYKKKIMNTVRDLDVEFIGLIKNKELLFSYLSHCKLFVFPSINENMSVMLLEAAAMKVPLICSDIPANTLIFNDDEVLFFENNNPNDLAEKIRFYINDTDSQKYRIQKAYDKLQTFYSWARIAAIYQQLYLKAMRLKNTGGTNS